jgi:hypothetical protein
LRLDVEVQLEVVCHSMQAPAAMLVAISVSRQVLVQVQAGKLCSRLARQHLPVGLAVVLQFMAVAAATQADQRQCSQVLVPRHPAMCLCLWALMEEPSRSKVGVCR